MNKGKHASAHREPLRHRLNPGICALVIEDDGLRVIGEHALTENELRMFLSSIDPLIRDIPQLPSSQILAKFPSGRPHHLEFSQSWEESLASENNQKTLDEFAIDIEAYLREEIKAALPDLCATPYRQPTVF